MANKKQTIIMCIGYPSTGKTTTTQKLQFQLSNNHKVALLTTVSIRESLGLMGDLYSEEDRELVYREIVKLVDEKLYQGVDFVILDGNFNKRSRREAVYALLNKYDLNLVVIVCKVDDLSEIEVRLGYRQKNPEVITNKAATMDLYHMIKDSSDPLNDDLLPNGEHPMIIEYDTFKQEHVLKDSKETNRPHAHTINEIADCLLSHKPSGPVHNIKAFIFDIGGVLQPLHWERVSNLLNEVRKGLTMDEFRNALYYEKEQVFGLYEVARFESDKFWDIIAQRLDIPRHFVHKLSESFKSLYGPMDMELSALIKELKSSHKLFILSNSCPELEEAVQKEGEIYNCFDRIYFSHKIGYKKPDQRAYQHVLEDNCLKAEECIFIDDVPRNVAVAAKMGIHGMLFLSAGKLRKEIGDYLKRI